jgi:F-type H+-transporting ATPase subunit c
VVLKEEVVKKKAFMVLLGSLMLMMAAPVFAAEGGAVSTGLGKEALGMLAAGFSMAFASAICGIAQGKAISAACEGVARNPGIADKLQLFLILGLAFIESLALYTLVIIFVKM